MKIRYYIFLRDVLWLTLSSVGGPQAHLATLLRYMVHKRKYITEEELLELNALCQILPGPTATQVITAIGFKVGGPMLAYFSLLIWVLPATVIMTTLGILMSFFPKTEFSEFVLPMSLGFLIHALYKLVLKAVTTRMGVLLFASSAVLAFFLKSPWYLPLFILLGGAVTSLKFERHKLVKEEKFNIDWRNFFLFLAIYFITLTIGGLTDLLPVKLFQNFYRNGALVFGGGQVLVTLLYKEFVVFKHYLTDYEFWSGYAIAQAVPGPVFSFSAYIGALSMREYGVLGQILGGIMATLGIFLPGTFLIFFVVRFWTRLKQYRPIRASLEGIMAVSAGLVVSSAFMFFKTIPASFLNYAIAFLSFLIITYTKIPIPLLIILGLIIGIIL